MTCVDPFTRLADVTFCVLDLETTGTSDDIDEIVEVGAVLVRGGHRLGTFQTMVRHPLASASSNHPTLGSVLASLREFVRGSVIVGHNIRFDLRFLNAALWKCGHDEVLDPADAIDTVALARRLLRDDADDCRLGTLAGRFGFEQRPTHRALADAAATVELLHLLIERATHYGALDLDDLMRLPSLMRHRHRAKLATTALLPRAAGTACLSNRHGEVLHVVIADDLRHAVRGLFDAGSSVPAPVLQHLQRVDIVQTSSPTVAHVAALRWSARTAGASRSAPAYLCRTAGARPRLKMTADRDAPQVVAGPMARSDARQVATLLSQLPVDRTDQFVESLQPRWADDADDSAALTDVLSRVAAGQRMLARARARGGVVRIADATLHIDDGCVIDIVAEGQSWAARLPSCSGDDRPGRPATPARAREAAYVAQLVAGHSAAMRDTWSPQY